MAQVQTRLSMRKKENWIPITQQELFIATLLLRSEEEAKEKRGNKAEDTLVPMKSSLSSVRAIIKISSLSWSELQNFNVEDVPNM